MCEFSFACLCVTSVCINCMPGINRAKFGRITRFVSALAAAIKPQPSERCQLSLLFPTIFLGCPLLRHVCIRFPATNQSNKNPSLFSSALSSFFVCFDFIYRIKAWLWEAAFPFQELTDHIKPSTSSKLNLQHENTTAGNKATLSCFTRSSVSVH